MIAATLVALSIAVSGGIARRRERNAQAKAASIAIWPYLNLVRGELLKIRDNPLFKGKLIISDEVLGPLERNCQTLLSILEKIEAFSGQLRSGDGIRVTAMIALCRYVSIQTARVPAGINSATIAFEAVRLPKMLLTDIERALELVGILITQSEGIAIDIVGHPLVNHGRESSERSF
jgi:hypothetical protein